MEPRSYIDTQMTGALKITRLLAPAINSDSEEDAEFPIRTSRAGALRGGNYESFPSES